MEIKKTVPPEAIYQLVREDYEAVAEWYDNKYDASREFAFQLHDFMNALPTNPKVLDIGAGTGKESLLLSKKSRVTAFDLSEAMLKRLKKLHPKIETKIGNMINLSFPENDFDGIWSCRSIIHIPYSDLERTLGGFNRVLKQGGTLGLIFLTPEEIGKEIVEEFLPETEAKIEGLNLS